MGICHPAVNIALAPPHRLPSVWCSPARYRRTEFACFFLHASGEGEKTFRSRSSYLIEMGTVVIIHFEVSQHSFFSGPPLWYFQNPKQHREATFSLLRCCSFCDPC